MTMQARVADTLKPEPTVTSSPAHENFTVAIIVPIFKHPVLLGEVVASVLAQCENPFPIQLILVDDGCPFIETRQMCTAFAIAHENIFYLRKTNGGLSSARNHGIEFIARSLPGVEFIYFLDADNRISPTMLRDTVGFLQANTEAQWVYPNIDKMGIEWSGNFSAAYSRLVHIISANICEAGSLIRRSVIDAGVRFDEEMKAGYEDWDFWLQCLDRGFVGINYPHFGFEYRQRAESMVRDSNREQSSIRNYMRKKHAKLLRPDFLLALEHADAPRFAAIGTDTTQVRQFTDPRQPHPALQFEEFNLAFWRAIIEPDTFRVPPFFCWIDDRDLAALCRSGMANSVFFAAERLAEQAQFVRLIFERSERTFGLKDVHVRTRLGPHQRARGWFAGVETIRACVDRSDEDWVESIDDVSPAPQVIDLVVTLPSYAVNRKSIKGASTRSLLLTLSLIKVLGSRIQKTRWNWRKQCLPHPTYHHLLLREQFNARPVSNRLREKDAKEIGIVLPVGSFGGVEKVAYNVAAVLKKQGYRLHLFILGGTSFEEIAEFRDLFETKNILAGGYPYWVGGERYMGHDVALHDESGAQVERVIGLLFGLDVIIHSHVAPLNSAIGEIRRMSTKVVGHFHVLDESSRGRIVGNPYLGLAFEHAYDLMLTCSEDLKEFMHGMGVPLEKLIHVPNMPGYHLDAAQVAKFVEKREITKKRFLNVVFLGRLDRQKGVARLVSVIRECKRRAVRIRWRIIGGQVIEGSDSDIYNTFAELGIQIERPIFDAAELGSVVAAADITLLLSRWEGAPLSIVEAQRLGCVPIATDVGAVKELIDHDVDGILISGDDEAAIVGVTCDELEDLIGNSERLGRLSKAGIRRREFGTWAQSVAPLLKKLDTWLGPGTLS